MRHLRPIAVLTVLALCTSAYGWTTCAGWQTTAAMRAACCKAADHQCAGAEIDACCAQGEQQHQSLSADSVPPAIIPLALATALLAPPVREVAARVDWHLHHSYRHVATYLLLSVFLV